MPLTDAFAATTVQHVAHGAFAPEGSVSIDALAALADAGHDVTFVEILSLWPTTGSTRTKFFKFSCRTSNVL